MEPLIRPAADGDWDDVRRMIGEYVAWVGLDLSFQGLDAEARELRQRYGPPRGACLVADAPTSIAAPAPENGPLAMVAIRALDDTRCEMKRLYVRPAGRGLGLGPALVARAIDAARQLGYAEMRLDTLPMMDAAQAIYERAGFRDIAPYYPSPIRGTRFMALDL